MTAFQQKIMKLLDDVPMGVGFIASSARDATSFVAQAYRGLTPREIQALLRSISLQERLRSSNGDLGKSDNRFKLRISAPDHKWLAGTLFQNSNQVSIAILVGRKTGVDITKKEQVFLKHLSTAVLELFYDVGLDIGLGDSSASSDEPAVVVIDALVGELQKTVQFDQGWLSEYSLNASSVKISHLFVPGQTEPKLGQQYPLDASASGWVIRHKKPRVDLNLASTQGRFMDQCSLYKQQYKSMMVLPLRGEDRIMGTLSIASKFPDQYSRDQTSLLDSVVRKLAVYMMEMRDADSTPFSPETVSETLMGRMHSVEDLRRILTSEVRRPLVTVHGALIDMTRMKGLPEQSRTTVERVALKVSRLGDVLSQVLEYGKPLKLSRTPCQTIPLLEEAVSFVHDDLAVKNIQIVPEYHTPLPLVRCDKAKMKSALVSLFRCAEEVIQATGIIYLDVAAYRKGLLLTLKCQCEQKIFDNGTSQHQSEDWVAFPIASQIIADHGGKVSVASGPGQATTIIVYLPAPTKQGARGRRR